MNGTHGKPHLLVLTTTFPRWPDDHEPPFVFELARRLTDRFDVTVLAPHTAGASRRDTMDGIDVRRFRYAPDRLERLAYAGGIPAKLRRQPWLAALVPSFVLAQLIAALQIVRERDTSVVHAHWLIPGGLVGAVIKELIPGQRGLLITAHGADVHLGGSWAIRSLKRLAVDSADTVSVVSRALAAKVAPLISGQTQIEVASMGVDLQRLFVPADQPVDEPVLVFAGRLVEKKGVSDLLAAMPRVRSHVADARLIIVGSGPLENELRHQVDDLGIREAVDFMGSVTNPDLPDQLRRARVAVLPFRTAADGDVEGLGLTAVEAMGCGLPVIVGDVPAVHDIVSHDQTGWLVPPASPDLLAEAVIRLLGDRPFAMRLGEAGRQFVLSRFDWSVVARRYGQLLSAIAD